MSKHTKKKNPYEQQAEELGDPRPQPQVSGADFTEETVPQNPPPEKPNKQSKEDGDKQAG